MRSIAQRDNCRESGAAMELGQLQAFVQIVDAGSFSAAAKRLGISQPALSNRIARLEASLAVTLMDRIGNSFALTSAGIALLREARMLQDRADAARAAVRGAALSNTPTVCLGVLRSIAPFVVPSVWTRLDALSPQADLMLREGSCSELLDRVLSGSIDLAVISAPVHDERVKTQILCTERLMLAVPLQHAQHPAAYLLSKEGLERVGALVIDDADGPPMTLWHHCIKHGVTPRLRCGWASLSTALAMVEQGIGMTVVPESARHCPSTTIGFVDLGSEAPQRTLALIWNPARESTPIARQLASILTECIPQSERV